MGGVIAALYGGAPDGGSVSSGGSGGVVGSGRPSTIGITTNKTTTATRMIAAIMMNVMTKVFVIDIYVLSSLSYEDNDNCIVLYTICPNFAA
jgi:hypothetical protein